ncbi:hypothetical protein BDZ89DRAFT_1049677 [Hymenopellis radicata]|nr:hypothetical protein BDZ89DRAFT_1049677 [Hymenopellis radicata]
MYQPLDIVYVIFGYLSAADLLNLSMSAKDVRAAVNSSGLWTQSILNTTYLPPRLPDLTPSRYVWLMLGKYCQACGCRTTLCQILERRRLCRKCLPKRRKYHVATYAEDQCMRWREDRAFTRLHELEIIRRERLLGIRMRLRSLNYRRHLAQIPYVVLARYRYCRIPRPLTDRSWNYIKPFVIAFVKNQARLWSTLQPF